MGGSVGVVLGADDDVDWDELEDDDDGCVTGCTGSPCCDVAADEEAACEVCAAGGAWAVRLLQAGGAVLVSAAK